MGKLELNWICAGDGVNLELGTELSDSDLRKLDECNRDFATATKPAVVTSQVNEANGQVCF
jgi:hypothetical protein